MSAPRRRAGFTLLEVLLATAIGAVLLGALYTALNMQLRYSQAGRDQVEHSLLVRTLLNRIASDIRLSLAPTIPPSSSASAGSGGGGGSSTGAGGSSGGMSSSSSSTTPTTAVQINLGVQGQTNQITLYVSRLPTDIDPLADNPVLGSDLRRI